MKNSRLFTLITVFALIFSVCAFSGCKDNDSGDTTPPTPALEYLDNEDGVTLSVAGIGTITDTDIVIPSEYNGKAVTGILKNAFLNNTTIAFVSIPSSVTIIGQSAFNGCSNLNKIIYNGTKTQWGSVTKGTKAFLNMGTSTIGCSDGLVSTYRLRLPFNRHQIDPDYLLVGKDKFKDFPAIKDRFKDFLKQ